MPRRTPSGAVEARWRAYALIWRKRRRMPWPRVAWRSGTHNGEVGEVRDGDGVGSEREADRGVVFERTLPMPWPGVDRTWVEKFATVGTPARVGCAGAGGGGQW
jgi:hypothetical protein